MRSSVLVCIGQHSHRAYRHEWVGEPETRPTATAQRTAEGDTIGHAIWSGATEVARWDVVDGSGDDGDANGRADRDDRRRAASTEWNGLDTTIEVNEFLESVSVIARDRAGRVIGRSAPARVNP